MALLVDYIHIKQDELHGKALSSEVKSLDPSHSNIGIALCIHATFVFAFSRASGSHSS